MTQIPLNVKQFASVRETSDEVAMAIFELAQDGDEDRMWDAPTEAELAAVKQRAFELAPDENVLHWGVERLTRTFPLPEVSRASHYS